MEQNVLLYILAFLAAVLVGWVIRLEVKVRRLLAGKDAKSLEDSILAIKRGNDELYDSKKTVEAQIADLRARLKKCVQRVETTRFNPFRGDGSGGNQSFVTAFADEDGNGVILSGLYARGGVNIYAKPVNEFASEFNLSEEERQVIEKIKHIQ